MTESSSGAGQQQQWKSRFPVARIKKIMQADEDVGKVAQVTPVAISKALELFMDRIIKAVADETKARGARRVTPSHFKQIISTQKQYDFLESLTSEIPLPPSRPNTPPPTATRRRRKQSPSAESTSTPSEPAAPKRKRRSPKTTDHDDAGQETGQLTQQLGEIKVEGDAKSEMQDVRPEVSAAAAAAVRESEDKKSRGWFDIVMGDSGDHDSSEDEGFKKRRVKDEDDDDEDYVP